VTATQIKPTAGGSAPAGLAAAPVGTGGTFAAATYFWKITFFTQFGETVGSNEGTTAIVANGSANLTWTAPPAGVEAVKVYRGTVTNTENALIAVLPGNTAAYTDTGLAGSAATPPAAQAFAAITLDGVGRCAKSSTYLAALPPQQLISALQAINSWHNAPTGPLAPLCQAELAALGLQIQDA
jgi:hypothetical protein